MIWNHGSQPPKRQGPGHPSHRIHGHSRPRAYEPGTEHGYTVLHSISSNCYSTTTATTIHAMQQGAEPGARATHDMIAARPPDPPILPLASVWCAPDATLDRRAPPFPLQVLPRVAALGPPSAVAVRSGEPPSASSFSLRPGRRGPGAPPGPALSLNCHLMLTLHVVTIRS